MCQASGLLTKEIVQNILLYFHNVGSAAKIDLESPVTDGKIESVIDYDNGRVFRGPKASIDGTIILNEMYFAYLWCISYFVLFCHDELNKEQLEGVEEGGFDLGKTEERENAIKLLNWGVSLQKQYSSWDLNLPNPNNLSSLSELEVHYVNKANIAFYKASSFLIYHEYAHIIFRHSQNDKSEFSKEQEKEADEFSRSVLIWDGQEKSDWISSSLGVVISALSMLFIRIGNLRLSSDTHPNIDLRIEHTFSYINNINSEQDKEWIKQILINGCQLYLQSIDSSLKIESKVEDLNEVFDQILNMFDSVHDSIWS